MHFEKLRKGIPFELSGYINTKQGPIDLVDLVDLVGGVINPLLALSSFWDAPCREGFLFLLSFSLNVVGDPLFPSLPCSSYLSTTERF